MIDHGTTESHRRPTTHTREQVRQHEADDHQQDGKAGRCGTDQPARFFRRILWRLVRRSWHGVGYGMVVRCGGCEGGGMSGVARSVVTGRDHKVVHADQSESEHRHHEEAGRESAGRAHPPIVTRLWDQRAPSPLSLL